MRYYCVQLSSFSGTNLLCTFATFQFHSVPLSFYPPLFLTRLILFVSTILRPTFSDLQFHSSISLCILLTSGDLTMCVMATSIINLFRFRTAFFLSWNRPVPSRELHNAFCKTQAQLSLSLSLSLLFNHVYLKTRTLGI